MNQPVKSTLKEWSEKWGLASSQRADIDEKGYKNFDPFEIWHHHAATRNPLMLALMLRFDQRR
jgi:hypothetical protein